MKPILIFGGTTEGRKMAEMLCRAKVPCTVCVATEYGESVLEPNEYMTVQQGRMTQNDMFDLMRCGNFEAVVDATHPYAVLASVNVQRAAALSLLPYYRLRRNTSLNIEGAVQYVKDVDGCIEALKNRKRWGNILLTTGTKDLPQYAAVFGTSLYVRVLPSLESIQTCLDNGIVGKNIIAMQGPFGVELNKGLMKQFHIETLVTKASGAVGGFGEKIRAAQEMGVQVIVIGTPDEAEGLSFYEVSKKLEEHLGVSLIPEREISLVGLGMGEKKSWTLEARETLEQAELVFGAKRLLEEVPEGPMKVPFYLAEDILPYLKEHTEEQKVVIVFSGDPGFYSGAKNLLNALKREQMKVNVISGISSLSYLAAKCGFSWQEAKIVSLHGRKANVLDAVKNHSLTFVLLSGRDGLIQLWEQLKQEEWRCKISLYVGYQLSYPEEKVFCVDINTEELPEELPEGMYSCFIQASALTPVKLTPGLSDDSFLRERVPMTKEEVREISLCKLNLYENAVVYDIGSGTGSISVECARLSPRIQVYAIEKKPEAAELTRKNCEKFGLSNVTVVEASAPDGLDGLPKPTHVFIGGSGGRLREMMEYLYRNQEVFTPVQVVVNAITLETLAEINAILKEVNCKDLSILQVQVSRGREVAGYHMMQAENPIYIVSFCIPSIYRLFEQDKKGKEE